MVIECAGHSAVREHGPAVLAAGFDLAVISIGALSDEVLHTELLQRARDAGARLFLPPGAVGGIDILAAARLSGIRDVVYTSRKPPQAWRGTPAEQLLDLDALTSEALFFEGTARAACQLRIHRAYPDAGRSDGEAEHPGGVRRVYRARHGALGEDYCASQRAAGLR